MNITERVERGAALLDERMPGWWRRVYLGALDIWSSCDCVAGQQPGGYPETMNRLGIGHSLEAAAHGFEHYAPDPDLSIGEAGRSIAEECAALTEAWCALILVRQAAASVTA